MDFLDNLLPTNINPMVIIAALMAGIATIFAMIAASRILFKSTEYEDFENKIDRLTKSEIAKSNLNKGPLEEKSWFGFWYYLYIQSGRKPAEEHQPGIIPLTAALLMGGFGFLVWPGDIFGLIVGAAAGILGCFFFFKREVNQRAKLAEEQLPQFLTNMRSNLQAAMTPQVAMTKSSQKLPSPLKDEFEQLREDLSLNIPLGKALNDMILRTSSKEFRFLLASIMTAVESGEDVEPQLKTIQEILRQRTRIAQNIATQVSKTTPTIYIAGGALPIAFIMSVANSRANGNGDGLSFWFSLTGLLAFGIIFTLYLAGFFIAWKLVQNVKNM